MSLTMWTAQTQAVLAVLEWDGRALVQGRYIDEKYGESAWIFRTVYRFLAAEMARKIPQPAGAESPFWLYADPKWAGGGGNSQLLRLNLPEEQVLLFDLRDWNKILNLSYLGTPEEEGTFMQKLRRQGLQDSLPVFQTAFYPQLRREIVQSWKRLLQKPLPEEQYRQGACWELRQEWICR